ncbi:MAG: guanylate kinase [Bacteroidales bacterium]
MQGKIIIICAPSGAGKTTLLKEVLQRFENLEFSVSATTRPPRAKEKHGQDYYFLSEEDFKKRITENQFVEWEEVYEGTFYGTPRSELTRIWQKNKHVVFDLDVLGGMNIKKQYPLTSLSVFIQPPSLNALRERLLGRGSETPESIEKRINRAAYEMEFAPKFDVKIVNDDLHKATAQLHEAFTRFLSK